MNDLLEFEFMTSSEMAKAIAKKAKIIRKKKFKTQLLFAQHIGISESKYARFEKTGQIQFVDFLSVLKGLNRIEDIKNIFDSKNEIIEW